MESSIEEDGSFDLFGGADPGQISGGWQDQIAARL
jgi:hypothetical protein